MNRAVCMLCVMLGSLTVGLAPRAEARQVQPGSILAATADLYSPAVAEIKAVLPPGAEARRGAGFFVGPGRFLTSRALLHGADSADVTIDAGRTLPVTKVVAEDVDADLVVVFVEVPSALRRGLAVSKLNPVPGEEGLVIGPATKPGEDLPRHTVVTVSVGGKARAGPVDGFELKGEIPGSLSGSPVLNASGQVIGVVSSKVSASGLRLAVSGVRVADLIDLPGLTLTEWSAGKSVDSTRPAGAGDAHGAAKARIVTRPDGSMLVDDRFVVTGKGTAAEPYVIPWDLLVSASEGYAPKQGRTSMPDRVAMLDGKQVRITGFVAFPLMVQEPSELLSMMNQWDGCCIGVPPTPYDAIEVQLMGPVRGDDRLVVHGTVTGRLKIDPQLVSNWLVGLYVMEDAAFKADGG
jgi:hypothetical protein